MIFPTPNITTDTTTHCSSSALLALKRFARGTLQQIGMGIAALLIVLNLGMPTSGLAIAEIEANQQASTPALPSEKDRPLNQAEIASAASIAQQTQPVSTHALVLQASMTQHHLTRARLIIPTTIKHSMVSVSEDN